MHVFESRVPDGSPRQVLSVLIDGSRYELGGAHNSIYLVALGDYKAKIVKQETKPTHEFYRIYELLFADGSTRKFEVTGQME